jgi:hypothetical protein
MMRAVVGAALVVSFACHAVAAAPVPDFDPPPPSPSGDVTGTKEMPAILVPTWHPAPDPEPDRTPRWDLPVFRVDGGAGLALGDGADSFSLRAHLGRSLWILERPEDRTRTWRAALRLTAGMAFGTDISSHDRAFWTAQPFVEIGLGMANAKTELHHARQATVFARAEPVLVPGALGERALRVGVGVTLHGFKPIWMEQSQSEDGQMAESLVMPFALPVLGALNVRDLEVTTDVGEDGRMQYGFVIGLGR